MKTNKILVPALMLSLFVTPYVFAEDNNNIQNNDNQNNIGVSENQDKQDNNESLKQQRERNREQNKQEQERIREQNKQDLEQQDEQDDNEQDQEDNEDQNIVKQLDNSNDFNYVDSLKIDKNNINKYSDVVLMLNNFKDVLVKIKDATNIQSSIDSSLTDAEKALLGQLVSQNKNIFSETTKNIDELNSYIDQYVKLLTPLGDANISKYIKGYLLSELNNMKDLISNEQDLAKEAINSVMYAPVPVSTTTSTIPATSSSSTSTTTTTN